MKLKSAIFIAAISSSIRTGVTVAERETESGSGGRSFAELIIR
jgi:hypothetical protein